MILSEIEQSIKNKIEKYGTPLKDWNVCINRGILTGYNEAFIINDTKRKELIATDPKSAEIIRPILRGRDIKRYGYEFHNLFLICTFPSLHINIDEYPAIKNYLLTFGIERLEQTGETYTINNKVIKARKKTNNKWFETQDSISYWDDFCRQKIMYSEIVQSPQFFLDKGEFYPEATTFIMTGNNLDFLVCCLNSNICFHIFKKFYGGLGENGVRYKKQFLLNLPIPGNFDKILFKNYSYLVCKNKNIIEEIENEIIKLYQLTEDEVNVLLNN